MKCFSLFFHQVSLNAVTPWSHIPSHRAEHLHSLIITLHAYYIPLSYVQCIASPVVTMGVQWFQTAEYKCFLKTQTNSSIQCTYEHELYCIMRERKREIERDLPGVRNKTVHHITLHTSFLYIRRSMHGILVTTQLPFLYIRL